jgi:hypothetical protein
MEKINYADIISSLALFIASISLCWNIVKDFIVDKMSVELHIIFGEVGNIKNSETALFAEAGSLTPNHKFDNVGTLVKIINIGRRSIVVRGVGGEFTNNKEFSMVVKGLPKLLNPYEEFSNVSEVRDSFMNKVKNNEVKKLWVQDTTGKKWFISKKGLQKLKETANYINQNKHL